jgi:enoyl-CoA hydratase/carnithine racemase
MKKSKIIEWEIKDNIGILKINNPPQNLLIEPNFLDINDLKIWISCNNIKGLIITGNKRYFSAGADKEKLFKIAKNTSILKNSLIKGFKILTYIENLLIPTISVINGACFGGGLEIALSTHFRICSTNSFFAFPETDLGLMPGLNGTIRLPKLIGNNKSLFMILSGEILDAEKALEFGIVDHIFPKNDTFDSSLNFIKKMTENRKIEVINSVIKSLNNSKKMSLEKAMKEEAKMFCSLALKEAKKIFEAKKDIN